MQAQYDTPCIRVCHSKRSGQFLHTLSRCITLPYSYDDLARVANPLVKFSTSCPVSSLLYHVCRIIGFTSNKKVVTAYTGWIITMVQHHHTRWDRTNLEFISNSVSHRGPMSCYSDDSVTIIKGSASPYPTFSTLIYLFPKSNFQWFVCSAFICKVIAFSATVFNGAIFEFVNLGHKLNTTLFANYRSEWTTLHALPRYR